MRGHRDGLRLRRSQPALQIVGEHQVGQLGLAVGGHPVVAAGLPLQVREVDLCPDVVRDARDRHHPGSIHAEQVLQQQAGEREMAEMVGAELQLEAVGGVLLRRVHHAGVVDEQVDPRVGGRKFGRRGAHRCQRAQIQFVHRHLRARGQLPNAGRRSVALGGVADRHHHSGATGGEHTGRVVAEAGVRAGDDRHSAALVGNVFLSPSHALEHRRSSGGPNLCTWPSAECCSTSTEFW